MNEHEQVSLTQTTRTFLSGESSNPFITTPGSPNNNLQTVAQMDDTAFGERFDELRRGDVVNRQNTIGKRKL